MRKYEENLADFHISKERSLNLKMLQVFIFLKKKIKMHILHIFIFLMKKAYNHKTIIFLNSAQILKEMIRILTILKKTYKSYF